jgi:hypothetical protein
MLKKSIFLFFLTLFLSSIFLLLKNVKIDIIFNKEEGNENTGIKGFGESSAYIFRAV